MIDELVRAVNRADWEGARALLYRHWSTECPKVFSPNSEHPWETTQDDNVIAESLLAPVAAAFCADASVVTPSASPSVPGRSSVSTSLVTLNEEAGTVPGQRRPGQICGYVFKEGEPTYSCKECATDPTCVLCQECFNASAHKGHKYRMYTSTGSGYCDCGDGDAWKKDFACRQHAVDETVMAHAALSPLLAERLRQLATVLLEYSTRVVTWPQKASLADHFPQLKMTSESVRAFHTILYNDETHTYDAVIRALELAVHCTKEQAMLLATVVDREGRSAVYAGSKENCERVASDIRRRTSRDHNRRTEKSGPLEVQVLQSELVSHQALAIILISWLNSQTSVFPLLCDVIGEVLLEERYAESAAMEVDKDESIDSSHSAEEHRGEDAWIKGDSSLITHIMKADRRMWKMARGSFHQLIMKTILMNMDQKMEFSRRFLRSYDELHREFIDDDHEHDVSVVSLSVQVLTVPPIARTLIAEESAMEKVLEALLRHCQKYISPSGNAEAAAPARRPRFDFTGRTYPATLKRALHMMRDQVYMLNQIPTAEEWTQPLMDSFIQGCKSLITFLQLMQGMDEVKRQSGEHQVWELEWETAFNMQLRSQETLTLVVAWASSNRKVHRRLVLLVLSAVEKVLSSELAGEAEGVGATHSHLEVHGCKVTVRSFDVLRQAVSVHQPLFRLLAALFAVPAELNDFLLPGHEPQDDEEKELKSRLTKLGPDLYEMQLRVVVLCAQAAAQLWRRNGFSLINQIHNYFSPLCRGEMYDQDIVMLQLGAALVADPNDFLIHVMNRYRVANWAEPSFDGSVRGQNVGRGEQEEMSKIAVTLAEEMFSLFINIISERYRPGIGVYTRAGMLEREVLHILAIGPQTFSHIQSKLAADPLLERLSLNAAVEKVGEFKKVTNTGPGHFILKEEFYERYDSFFYHYSRTNSSQAEQYQRKIRAGKDRRIQACAPPIPSSFCPLFSPVTRLLRSPVLVRTLQLVAERTAKRNRFSSENLLHRALHLTGLALHEQTANPLGFDFLSVAEEAGLIQTLSSLSGTPEAQPYADLLWWTLQKYKEVEKLVGMAKQRKDGEEKESGGVERNTEKKREEMEADEETKRKEKSAKAAKMRAKAMMQMNRMQKNFMEQHHEEMEEPSGADIKKKEAEGGMTAAEKAENRAARTIYDEDEDAPILSEDVANEFPVCIGAKKMNVTEVHSRLVTCVVCQEQEELGVAAGKFVCAALVHKSHLFSKPSQFSNLRLESFLVNSSLDGEKETTTCSHTMHLECYQNLYDAVVARERARPRQALQQNKLLDAEGGEYLCPLCKRLSNTALPLIPALQIFPLTGFSTNRPPQDGETFESWTDEIRRFVALSKPKHSRKRSHSERSLLEMGRERERESREQMSAMGSGCLETALSSSVPSASQMNLLLDQSALPLLRPVQEPRRSPSPPPLPLDQLPPHEDVQDDVEVDVDEMEVVADQELLNLMRGGAMVEGVAVEEREGEGAVLVVVRERVEERRRQPADLAEAVQRRVHAIPTMLSAIIKTLPAAILAKLSKRIVPAAVADHEDSVRYFTKYLMKKDDVAEETRSFSSTVAVWRTTTHVVRAVAAILEVEKKPLFGALNTRQRDGLLSLVRLSAVLSSNMQPFTEVIRVMLRILLHPSVANPFTSGQPRSGLSSDAKSPSSSAPLSPPPVYNCHASNSPLSASTTSVSKKKSSALAMIFGSDKKEATFHLLHIDILSLTIELMMCIGWTWLDGERTVKGSKSSPGREMIPDGSVDELYILRLGLVAFHFQVMATFVDSVDEEMEKGEEERPEVDAECVARVEELWGMIHRRGEPLREGPRLAAKLREATLIFLRPLALLYHSLRLLPPPEALRDPSVDIFEPLCRYLGVPPSLKELLSSRIVDELFPMWAPCIPEDISSVPQQPFRPNQLIALPHDFSELVLAAARFRCPSIPLDEKTASMPTMCLVCGQLLCSQSYCCQKTINKENVGACMQHLATCSGPNGIFLRIRDCYIVLLTTRLRGCIRPAPYVDEFGEVDQGFRRGNPLHLNTEMYAKLRHLWLHQGIAEEVVNRYEMEHRNLAFEWNHF